jgi:hypothetical protein
MKLETMMSEEGFYSKPHSETVEVQDKFVEVSADLEAAEAEWLDAQG